jgi:CDGSH-type Zn-finger protein
MAEPQIASKTPYAVELEAGNYFWCACGKSKKQPLCDASHKGSEFTPVKFTIEEKKKVYMCGCKHTTTPPLCNGTHKKL